MKTARDYVYHALKISQVGGLQDSANIDSNLANLALTELNSLLEQNRLDEFLPCGTQTYTINNAPKMVTFSMVGTPTQLTTQDIVDVKSVYVKNGDAYQMMSEMEYLTYLGTQDLVYSYAVNRNNQTLEIHLGQSGLNVLVATSTKLGSFALDDVIDLPESFFGWITYELGALMADIQRMDSVGLWEKAISRKSRLKRLNEKSIELDSETSRFDFNSGRFI